MNEHEIALELTKLFFETNEANTLEDMLTAYKECFKTVIGK